MQRGAAQAGGPTVGVASASDAASFILTEDKKDVETLLDETREAIEKFYGNVSSHEAMKVLKEKEIKNSQDRQKSYATIDLRHKSKEELLDLLKHRDDTIKLNAAVILDKMMRGDTVEAPNAKISEATMALIRQDGVRLLIFILSSSALDELLLKAVIILLTVLNDDLKDKVRQIGGLGPIANLLQSKNEDLVRHVLILIVNLALNEENREGFRRVNALDFLVAVLSTPNTEIQALAIKCLLNLSITEKNQAALVKAGALPPVMKLVAYDKAPEMQLNSILLLFNISHCDDAQLSFTPSDLRLLISHFVDPRRIYSKSVSWNQRESDVQTHVIAVLAHAASKEQNRPVFLEGGFLETLMGYFEPMKDPSIRWDFDVLDSVLALINHLVHDEEQLIRFFELSGQERVSAIVQHTNKYPEDILCSAAGIVATLSINANSKSQAFAVSGIKHLLGLLSFLPDKSVVQLLVAKTFASLAAEEKNKSLVLQLAGLQLLVKFLMTNKTKGVIVNCCRALASLSSLEPVREAIIGNNIVVPQLITLLGYNAPELQIPIGQILSIVASDERGLRRIMEYGGLLPLVSILSSKNLEVQQQSLRAIAALILDAQHGHNREVFVQKGGAKALLALMVSPSEDVQLLALGLLKGLCKYEEMRAQFLKGGINSKLKELEEHPNFKKENSIIEPTVQMLMVNFKGMQDATSMEIGERAKHEGQLDQLSKRQLIELILEAISMGCPLGPSINKMLDPPQPTHHQATPLASSNPEQQQGKVAPPPAPKGLGASAGPVKKQLTLMDEIKGVADAGGARTLRHVDLQKRVKRESRQSRRFFASTLMQELHNFAKTADTKQPKLLDESTEEGRRYYEKDMERYIEELEKCFLVDYSMMKVIFKMVETDHSVASFSELYSLLDNKDTTEEVFAKALLSIGFSIKSRRVLLPDATEPTTEYTMVIAPSALPVKVVLKAILYTITHSATAPKQATAATPTTPTTPPTTLPTTTTAPAKPPAVFLSRQRTAEALPTHSQPQQPQPHQHAEESLHQEKDREKEQEEEAHDQMITCGLCKKLLPQSQSTRISHKDFCSECHNKIIALAKKRGVTEIL